MLSHADAGRYFVRVVESAAAAWPIVGMLRTIENTCELAYKFCCLHPADSRTAC